MPRWCYRQMDLEKFAQSILNAELHFMAIILVEPARWRSAFYPLTLTRPLAELQCGFLNLVSWWQMIAKCPVHTWTGDYLEEAMADWSLTDQEPLYFIRSGVIPSIFLWQQIQALEAGHQLTDEKNNLLAFLPDWEQSSAAVIDFSERLPEIFHEFVAFSTENRLESKIKQVISADNYQLLDHPASLLAHQGAWMRNQFTLMTEGLKSAPLPSDNWIQGEENIFLEEGATVHFAYLNGLTGPIYIGRDAMVMEGAMIRGPFGLGENSTVKMGAKIYGATATGAHCTLGGEIKNTLFHQGSNKGHEGYLGDSLIGAWCNFGAGAGNSNVKNTAGEVSLFDYGSGTYLPAGKKFGLIMGDYSRIAINSAINTGSSIGVCSNVFGHGLLPKFIPSFSWGTANQPDRYDFDQAAIHIKNWMLFKQAAPSAMEIQILRHIFDHTS